MNQYLIKIGVILILGKVILLKRNLETDKLLVIFLKKDYMRSKNMIKEDDKPMGIIPAVLKHLLDARNNTKKLMKKEPNEFKEKVLDGLQLAYKVTANSVYGQLGAKTSNIYKMKLAACTTSVGRSRIDDVFIWS